MVKEDTDLTVNFKGDTFKQSFRHLGRNTAKENSEEIVKKQKRSMTCPDGKSHKWVWNCAMKCNICIRCGTLELKDDKEKKWQ